MKRVILHIGLPKTGTTALQLFLQENTAGLEKNGIGVFSSAGHYKGSMQAMNGAFLKWDVMHSGGLAGWRNKYEEELCGKDREAFSAYAGKYDTQILTDEFFSMAGNSSPQIWEITKERICSLVPGDTAIDIAVYLRRQDVWSFSWWKQSLHTTGGRQKEFDPFVTYLTKRENRGLHDYEKLLQDIERVFGIEHMIVRSYDALMHRGGDLIRDFFAAAGLDWQDSYRQPEGQINSSLTLDAARALRLIRSKEAPFDGSEDGLRLAAETFSVLYPEPRNVYPIPEEDRKELMKRCEESNRRVEERYMGGEKICADPDKTFETRLADRERDMKNAAFIAKLAAAPKGAHEWMREHKEDKGVIQRFF